MERTPSGGQVKQRSRSEGEGVEEGECGGGEGVEEGAALRDLPGPPPIVATATPSPSKKGEPDNKQVYALMNIVEQCRMNIVW